MSVKRKIIPYNPDLKSLAKELRKNMTLSEVLLWNELRKKQMLGYDFDRQRPIDNFIVDFYCKELSLAIEIDGDTHIYRYEYDEERQKTLEKLGIQFLRFEDREVKKDMNNVLSVIENWILKNKLTPGPSGEGSSEDEHCTLKNKPTPSPSGEGSSRTEKSDLKNKPTPGPSGEGSSEDEHCTLKNKPTPGPSGEGNLENPSPAPRQGGTGSPGRGTLK